MCGTGGARKVSDRPACPPPQDGAGGAGSLGSAGISAAGAVLPLTATGSGGGDSSLAGAAFCFGTLLSRGLGGWASSGGRLIRLGWAASAGLCRRLLFVGLGRCLLRFFSLRGTATAGLFSVQPQPPPAAFPPGPVQPLSRAGREREPPGWAVRPVPQRGAATSGAAGSACFTVSRAAALRSAISSSILSKDTTTSPGSDTVTPACSCGGCPSGQIRGRGIGAGNNCGRSLGSNRLAFDGGNIFLFLHLLTSNLSVILHKNELENFVLIFFRKFLPPSELSTQKGRPLS